MIIALVHYDAPLEEVDRFVAEHRAYLAGLYAEKKTIFSGRQNPPAGGVILFNLPSKEAVLDIAKNYPFVNPSTNASTAVIRKELTQITRAGMPMASIWMNEKHKKKIAPETTKTLAKNLAGPVIVVVSNVRNVWIKTLVMTKPERKTRMKIKRAKSMTHLQGVNRR